MSSLRVDDRVSVSSIPGSKGTVRFAGETSFSAGTWIGVELDEGGGKNDGSVAGKRYFTCKAGYGVFAKPNGVKRLAGQDTTPRARQSTASSSTARSAAGGRVSAMGTRSAVVSPPNTSSRPPSRYSAASSRPPSVTPGGSRQPLSRMSSTTDASASKRSSIASVSAMRSPGLLSPDLSKTPESPASPTPDQRTIVSPVAEPSVAPAKPMVDPFSLATRSDPAVATRDATVPAREHEETLSKLRILERARTEDRERLRELERLKEEERNWKDIQARLKAKMVEMQGELKTLRVQAKEATSQRDNEDNKFADLNEELEMATLDKEVAEEKVDALEATVATLKERVAELEVETSVFKSTEDDGSESGKSAQLQLVQLSKQNDRLKDALSRMRDLTAESEAESRRRIADLEKELDLTSELQAGYDAAIERAELAETHNESLKQQLDDAETSEDVLVELSERNLTLSEQLEDRNAIIEDLEAQKELSDELEEAHVETEKQMQEEIDLRNAQLRDQRSRNDELDEAVVDYEATIGQFRELVLSLQSDIESMRRQHDEQSAESQSLSSQSQAMLALNMKLQQNVTKTQVKTIDLELRRLDAMQAIERLEIVRPYLPASFFQGDSDAVDALLFFERLSAKTELISSALAQKHNIADSLSSVVTDVLVSVCEARSRLSRFAVLTKRFAANLRRCPTETFLAMGGLYRELSGIEKRVDSFIEALRRDELTPSDCSKEVDKFIAQAAHLAEMHLGELGLDYGEQQVGVVMWLDLDLDTVVAGLGFTKQSVATLHKDPKPEDANLASSVYDPIQLLIDQARTAQSLARKILRRIGELAKKAAHLTQPTVEPLAEVSRSMQKVASICVKMAELMNRYASDIRLSHSSLSLASVEGLMQEAAQDLRSSKTSNVLAALDTDIALAVARLTTGLNAVLDSEQVVRPSHMTPWSQRVAELAAQAAQTTDAEHRATKLGDEVRDLRREIRIRESAIQESAVKIEVMDKRMEAVKKQADSVAELESELASARRQEHAYEETVAALQADIEEASAELNKYKTGAIAAATQGSSAVSTDTSRFVGSLETAHLVAQVESLRAAMRHVRRENAFLRSEPLALPPLPAMAASPSNELRELRVQHRSLLKDTLRLASTPTMVDVSAPPRPFEWRPTSQKPERQLEARKDAVRSLNRRLDVLKTRVSELPRMTSVTVSVA